MNWVTTWKKGQNCLFQRPNQHFFNLLNRKKKILKKTNFHFSKTCCATVLSPPIIFEVMLWGQDKSDLILLSTHNLTRLSGWVFSREKNPIKKTFFPLQKSFFYLYSNIKKIASDKNKEPCKTFSGVRDVSTLFG